MRGICYSIGVVAHRLIYVSSEEGQDKKSLNKLNILQGGIEARFIPCLT